MIDRKTYEKEYMGKIVSDEEIINFLQRLMCCGNCKHNSKTKMYKNPCRQCFELSCWELVK